MYDSAIHKAGGLTVPGRSMILPGTIPETPISREWSRCKVFINPPLWYAPGVNHNNKTVMINPPGAYHNNQAL